MNTPTTALIKETALLRQKKARDESHLILVEGRHPIEEAVRAGLVLKSLFVLPTHPGHLPLEAVTQAPYVVDEKMMGRLCTTDSPPPCLAVFERPTSPKRFTGSFALVLDSIQDPGNLGTLIRSAIAFGVEGVILTGNQVAPYNPKVIRSSAGLVFCIPILNLDQQELNHVLTDEWRIYVTTGDPSACHYRRADYGGRCAIVLGNEGRGVSEHLFSNQAVQALTIPMNPEVESLNVAISGSIILAEASAKRQILQLSGAGNEP